MSKSEVSKAAIGRMPVYLKYLKSLPKNSCKNISATTIAKELNFGEVQVRKDLSSVSGAGKPKIGYDVSELIKSIESFLKYDNPSRVVIIGAGKLGRAILDYGGFSDYGLEISAAFDNALEKFEKSAKGKPIYPVSEFERYCKDNSVKIAVITVPCKNAQEACDMAVKNNVCAIWNFTEQKLKVPSNIAVQYENIALSLANLNKQINN